MSLSEFLTSFVVTLLMLIIHPTVFFRMVGHSCKTGHRWNADVMNFRYHVWCDGCDKIFIKEHDEHDE